jgi:hypothetical protein
MITKRKVSSAIDKAAIDIDWCWNVLVELRKNKRGGHIGGEIINFQQKLIASLWTLDDVYREIHAERKRLIGEKTTFEPSWFKKRMATLANYQQAVRHAISIAKVVGDGFAWIFYWEETKLIDAHLKTPRQVHLPPKIGRIGERGFVEQFQVVEGKLVLYHGITTFLRMGDVSFYDFSERRITNIGELKTEHIKGNEYRINLGFVYGGQFSPVIDIRKLHEKDAVKSKMMPDQAARLNRQLKQIAKAISPEESRISETRSQQGLFYFDELDRLIEASSTRVLKSKKVGRGLLIAILRLSGDVPLSQRLLADKKFYIGKKLDGMTAAAQSIVDPALADNSLLISNLGVGEKGIPALMKGTIPIFWWPIKSANLHDLIFSNVIAMTLYNPALFWHLLRTSGFQVSIGDRARLVLAKKQVGRRVASIHNFEYFQMLITHYLMSEDDVLFMIESALQVPIPDNASMRIEISPQIRF